MFCSDNLNSEWVNVSWVDYWGGVDNVAPPLSLHGRSMLYSLRRRVLGILAYGTMRGGTIEMA